MLIIYTRKSVEHFFNRIKIGSKFINIRNPSYHLTKFDKISHRENKFVCLIIRKNS
jgi:hypothetical protein